MQPSQSILIVDDDPMSRLIATRFVNKLAPNATAVVVESAMEAIEYLSRNDTPDPTLIFLDIQMPEMSGFDFLDWWAENMRASHSKIVVCSSSINFGDKARSLNNPFVSDYIEKPLSVERMHAMLTKYGVLG